MRKSKEEGGIEKETVYLAIWRLERKRHQDETSCRGNEWMDESVWQW